MLYVLMMILCLTASPLFAETIGNIEYSLPKSAQGWKIGNELYISGDRISTTIIYVPEKASRKNAKEFFGVYISNLPSEGFDHAILEKTMKQQFPKQNVTVSTLETDPHSVLFEWIVKQGDKEKKHGWTRMFALKNGTALLIYETLEIENIKNISPAWIEILKKAKLVQE